ncbi:Immunoglobulin like fold-containing protein [Desulfonema limicola]|uniref:Immunoglobulin like fold-containing protein n=1 Tax=Desulfonema limicola TaxID=45656 RepID=A0A975GG80_9BACT|nr:LamG-like jellyroll fold domain-containing protein [Desulfonema limicola]QTA80022.1 Immunoglobulin like fold-containing protein [Desulfonema limicola]
MKFKTYIFIILFLALWTFPAAGANYDYIQLIDTPEFKNKLNADMIINNAETQTSGGDCEGYVLVTSTMATSKGEKADEGVPSNGIFNISSEGTEIKCSTNWSGNNVYKPGNGTYFTLYPEAGIYEYLLLSIISPDGAGSFSAKFTYSDGSTSTSKTFTVPHWEYGAKGTTTADYYVMSGTDMDSYDTGGSYEGDDLFLYYFKLLPANTKQLKSVQIINPKSGSNKADCGLFVLGGVWKKYKAPEISDFTPTKAKTGDTITINGTNFENGSFKVSKVTIGGSSVSFTVNSAAKITAKAGSNSGPVTVESKTGSGTSDFSFTLDTTEPPVSFTYYNKDGSIVPENDDTAVRRVRTGGGQPDITEYAVSIRHDFSESANVWGYQETIGNPKPAVGKHWYQSGDTFTLELNGIVQDLNNVNLRYVMAGFRINSTLNEYSISQNQTYTKRINSPMELEIVWHSQWAVQVGVVPDSMKSNILVVGGGKVESGIGRWWFDDGASLELFAFEGCLPVEGYLDNTSLTDVSVKQGISGWLFLYFQRYEVKSLKAPVSITWQYKSHKYEIEVPVGAPVSFETLPGSIRDMIDTEAAPTMPLDAASAQTGENLYYWSEADKKAFPLIGDRWFQLEWKMKAGAGCAEPVVTLVHAKWPDDPHYTHIANTPPVLLDPSPDDGITFQELKYTDKNSQGQPIGKVADTKFTATEKGKSVLLLTSDEPIQQFPPIIPPGQISLKFNGTDDYVEIENDPDTGNLYLDNTSYTIEAWIKPDEIPSSGYATIIENDAYYMGINSKGNLYGDHFYRNNKYKGFSAGSIQPGKWTHVAFVFNKEVKKIYLFINGILTGTFNLPDALYKSDTEYVRIGSNTAGGNRFKGYIDEVRVWNIGVTQIWNNMNKRLSGNETGLVGYWRFDEYGTTSLTDSSPSKQHASFGEMKAADAWTIDSSVSSEYESMILSTMVRVVQTKLWNEDLNTGTAVIGSEITSNFHDSNVPHTGHVYSAYGDNTKQLYPRYNADIYDPQTMEGPIIPVNKEYTADLEDNMVVVWYEMKEGISWPYQPVRYNCSWPSSTENRIVIASRQGSEGRNKNGAYQTWPDSEGNPQNWLDPKRYSEIKVYNQPDKTKPGYNPNEEHALTAGSFRHADMAPQPTAAFALRNDLNITARNANFTSEPYVLLQYFDNVEQKYGMTAFKIDTEDSRYAYPDKVDDYNESYTFHYSMKAGDPVVAPYPLNLVIGAAPPDEISGTDGSPDVQKCYWEDHKGQPWAISGGSYLHSRFWYPLDSTFWCDGSEKCNGKTAIGDGNGDVGQPVPFIWKTSTQQAVNVRYDTSWPENLPVLKAGETVTFPGGEYRADNPENEGLPAVLAWAAGQVVYDDMNTTMDPTIVFQSYLVRLVSVLEERTVALSTADYPSGLAPASGKVDVNKGQYYFKDLHAGLKTRIFYDPITAKLGIRGYVNDKTLGDSTLTAAPPSVYILQPNILTSEERDAINALEGANEKFKAAVNALYELTVNPSGFTGKGNTAGIQPYKDETGKIDMTKGAPLMALGPGLAAVPNPRIGSPDPNFQFSQGYVTLAENNHPDMGDLPVALHIIKVKNEKYRGAIKAVYSDNVFDEKITMRHTADFGSNVGDQLFQWWYREENGTEQPPPDIAPEAWKVFPGQTNEVVMSGAGAALLSDNLFFVRYKHKDCEGNNCWSEWAGAANSRPPKEGEDPADTYQAQLAEGWVKRVVNGINPFEARIKDFSTDSPATYVSMIQQAGPRYEGDVAFNPQKDVIENVGLIELYQTVLERAKDLSIDLTQPANTSGVVTALLLAASRVNGFYTLLGNDAYIDAQDPTIGFGSSSLEYGSLAPTIFTFMNQIPNLLDEELCLLRGQDQEGARPVYNRLMWNFTKGEGEAAYAMSYNLKDENGDGFIDEADGRTAYPQGHGDAWGHYLSALKGYYTLMRHPYFNWESRAEKLYIEGVVIDVDYLDERKFAETAAAKAKAGSEIVNLTYRSQYVDDPAGQWQGYMDTDRARSWGVSEWGERAFLGTLYDWAIANAILPDQDTDPAHTGVKKIDRTTITELLDIASQGREIQRQLDSANIGLNPLGLVADVVPFDIDPSRMVPGAYNSATQFEQVYERALSAMENAQIIFDYANDMKNRIRKVAVSAEEFSDQVEIQDRDYRNRLIEVFGTPYEGLIGAGKIYPAGYQGPDYFCYNYIDVNDVTDKTLPEPGSSFTAYFEPMARGFSKDERLFGASGTILDMVMSPVGGDQAEVKDLNTAFSQYFMTDLNPNDFTGSDFSGVIQVEMPMGAGDYSFQAPSGWGIRKSPGEIQVALIELVKAETELKIAMANYAGFVGSIQLKLDTIIARNDLYDTQIYIDNARTQTKMGIKAALAAVNVIRSTLSKSKEKVKQTTEAVVESMPKSTGTSSDVTAPARSAARRGGIILTEPIAVAEKAAEFKAWTLESSDALVDDYADLELVHAEAKYDLQQQLKELQDHMGDEVVKRMEVFRLNENLRQIGEKYRAMLAKGLRLLEERKAFNAKVAAKVQGKRYQDMAFRLNANAAVSQYKAMFDVAARNVYLAAKAYDYETNLGDNNSASAKPLLNDIIKQRTLGQYKDGRYIVGLGGLGDTMERLKANFDVLKGQMGFNNPQSETGRMSLRYELFRIKSDEEQDESWRAMLQKSMKENLWDIPEFKKYCRPFISEDEGPQPGIVIDFTTNVVSGKNFFGHPLGGGDHAYDPTNFATKVRSVGVWFEGYDNSLLAETPRAYMIPVGMDIMLVPDSNDMATREWTITDQKIPVPLPVGKSDMSNPDWIPSLDSLDGSMVEIRRYSSFRAYHDAGYFDASQMNYDSRLIGRSVWNTRWMIIIPGATFHYDKEFGLNTFIDTVKDIKLFFQTYAMSGN